jgi:hypothetical protein
MHFRKPKSQWSPTNRGAESFPCATQVAGLNRSSFVLILCLLAVLLRADAHQQDPHYVQNRKATQLANQTLAYAKDRRWQIWLYQDGVRIPDYAAGLQYSRWGLIEGGSAESILKQLRDAQSFEEAYLNFFGPGTWGRHSFFNPLGPIAARDQAAEKDPTALEARYQLDILRDRVNGLIAGAQPSLESNESEGRSSPHKEYFDQIRDALQQVCELHSQLARTRHEVHFISKRIERTDKVVRDAANNLRTIRTSLRSVKLPTSTTWMFHTERAGSDGTLQAEVRETGSAVSVHRSWTGGDGSMTGTVIITIIPFDDIGEIALYAPREKGDEKWTVFVQPGRNSFPETVNSPLRHTSKRILPAVNLTSTSSFVYFTFDNPAEAQNAYAYFLYHKQLGR